IRRADRDPPRCPRTDRVHGDPRPRQPAHDLRPHRSACRPPRPRRGNFVGYAAIRSSVGAQLFPRRARPRHRSLGKPANGNRARYTIIGLFTLIVIAVAFVFVYWLKRLDESGVRSTMYLEFPGTVSGLEPGGSVYFNGLKVGEVVGLSFKPEDPNIIVVTTSVRADTPIKTDTKAKVGSSILTGVAYIELNGGSSKAPSVFTANPPLVV